MCLRIFVQELGEFYGGGLEVLEAKEFKENVLPNQKHKTYELSFNFQIFFHPDFCLCVGAFSCESTVK